MNPSTITIEPSILAGAERYAKAHNTSVRQLAERYLASLMLLVPPTNTHDNERKGRYKISPKVKALECGFVAPTDLSEDYKKELSEYRASRYE